MSNRVLTIIFCLGLPTIIMLVFAVIGTKYRVKLVNHISQKMKSGSYAEIAAGKNNNKIRVFTAIGLIDIVLLGLLIILIVIHPIFISSPIVLSVGLVLMLLGLASGFSLYNTIRRL